MILHASKLYKKNIKMNFKEKKTTLRYHFFSKLRLLLPSGEVLEPLVRLMCVCLDRGRKTEDLQRTTQARREHAAATQNSPGPGNETCGCSAVAAVKKNKQTDINIQTCAQNSRVELNEISHIHSLSSLWLEGLVLPCRSHSTGFPSCIVDHLLFEILFVSVALGSAQVR